MNDYFQYLARYNRWANQKLYAACAELSSEEYLASRPSFFGSIHRTLNHIMVADIIWLDRFASRPTAIRRLDEELYATFAALEEKRRELDRRIETVIAAIDNQQIALDLQFLLISKPGETSKVPMRLAMAHFFNHQTHHRGQVHDQLSQTKVSPPSLDLIYFAREQ